MSESDPNILIETSASAKTAAHYAGDWIADAYAAIARVEALHEPEAFFDEPDNHFCGHCQRTAGLWPCATIRALRGEDQ